MKAVCAMLILTAIILSGFVQAFEDDYGSISANLSVFMGSCLYISMIIRRDSVKGQSLYIGLLMLIGDLAGNLPGLITQKLSQENSPVLWLNIIVSSLVVLRVFYIYLYFVVAKRDGVNPWKRL